EASSNFVSPSKSRLLVTRIVETRWVSGLRFTNVVPTATTATFSGWAAATPGSSATARASRAGTHRTPFIVAPLYGWWTTPRGSKASRRPSPTRLYAITVRKIHRPGKKLTHHARKRLAAPSATMPPQEAVGGG